ncbi:extracellular solute-binding protein [Streptomyces bathyalis]|uniref:Extracellular solute-binding protein n=1 Tax=Streptomyces bathyalis TaxID=2710756 RepID=A0A7T1T391_9ACTN|nr:extracellular solute-binding protein [Streptomyces bathyalis]QPP05550.1 extracellular solute-binding protein [Streptomyces bathyalis]
MAAPPGRTRRRTPPERTDRRSRPRLRSGRPTGPRSGRFRAARPAVAAAAALLGLLPLTACGGVSVADNRSGTFTTMGFGLGDAIATSRIDDARKALAPRGMDLQINEGAFDEQQFLSAVAAGDPPDVVNMDRSLIGGYAARGALLPLTDCLRKEHIDLGDYQRSAIAEATLDGAVYGMPDSFDSRILLMDASLLKKAGHDATDSDVDTSDWKQLRKLNLELKQQKGNKLTRLGFDPKIPEFFPMWARANGGSLISDDGRTAKLNSPRVVEALEMTSGLIRAQGGWGKFKALRDSFDQFGKANQFTKHQVGAYPMEDWYVAVLGDTSPQVQLGSGYIKDRKGKPVNYVSGTGWAVPKGSRHPEEACTFIKTMTSTRAWVKAAEAKAKDVRGRDAVYTGDYTGNLEADKIIESKVWKPSGNKAFDKATRQLYDIQAEGFAIPANAAGSEFKQAWQDACNRVLSGEQTPRQALDQAQREAQSALDIADQGRK